MAPYGLGKICCLFGATKKKDHVGTNGTRCNPDQCSIQSTISSDEDEAKLRPSDIQAFSASSTLHGFSHMFASHHSLLRRIFWGIAFFASILVFTLQCTNRAGYYFSFPHVTKLDEVTAGDLEFPAVTICNVNEFRFSQITKNDMFYAGTLLGILDDRNNLIRPPFYSEVESMDDGPTKRRLIALKKKIDKLTTFNYPQIKSQFNMHEFYERTSHNLSQFLLRCKYRGTICNDTWFSEIPDEGYMSAEHV